jgi:hypothetical protein
VIVALPAGLAALGAVVLAVAGFAGGWIVTAAAGLCVLALAIGWGELLRLPDRSGSAFLIGLLGAAGLVGGTLAVWPRTAFDRPLAFFAALLAGAVLTSFAHELFRQDGRHELVESITGTLSGQMLALLAAGWVLTAYTTTGGSAILVAAAAIAVARLGSTLPLAFSASLRPAVTAWIGFALGVLAALVAAFFVDDVSVLTAAAVGVAVSGAGIAVAALVTPLDPDGADGAGEAVRAARRFDRSMLAQAAAPLAAAGTVAYAVVRIGLG